MQFCFKYSLEVREWPFFFFLPPSLFFFPLPHFLTSCAHSFLLWGCAVHLFLNTYLLRSPAQNHSSPPPPSHFLNQGILGPDDLENQLASFLIKRLCLCTHGLRTIGCLKALLSWLCFTFSFLQSGELPSKPWLQELSIPGPIYLRALKSLLLHRSKFQT